MEWDYNFVSTCFSLFCLKNEKNFIGVNKLHSWIMILFRDMRFECVWKMYITKTRTKLTKFQQQQQCSNYEKLNIDPADTLCTWSWRMPWNFVTMNKCCTETEYSIYLPHLITFDYVPFHSYFDWKTISKWTAKRSMTIVLQRFFFQFDI